MSVVDQSLEHSQSFDSKFENRKKSGMFDFANPEAIKERVRQSRQKPLPYNVHDHYWKTGLFQWIAKHTWFENVTLIIICINALWIWIDTDYNTGETLLDAPPGFVIMDCLFCSYFCIELLIRFLAFERKSRCFCDGWFMFDSCLVALYLFDPFVLTIVAAASGGGGVKLPTAVLRLFRLARLSRLVRMLRSLPELMIFIKGMITAAATVSYTLGLLLVITYVFAIALTQLSRGMEFREQFFNGVPLSMYSLIIHATFLDDLADFADSIRAESSICLIISVIFIILASMTVMNMLIGVLCEVISAVAEEEREAMITDKVYEKFSKICERLDSNLNGRLSWPEFQQIMASPDALAALDSVNVDPYGMIDFAEDFFFEGEEPKEISFRDFMDMVLDFRGGQTATLKDVMLLGKQFNRQFTDMRGKLEKVNRKLDRLEVDEG